MPMEKIYGMYVALLLLTGLSDVASAQVYSAQVSYSPSTSTLIDEATRYGYQVNNYSNFYMRYNDTAYLCSHMLAGLWLSNPVYNVIPLPQNFVIEKMKRAAFFQGFVGSFAGVGMYGRLATYPVSPGSSCNINVFQLPAVDQLDRVAYASLPYVAMGSRVKAFAIGQKAVLGTYLPQSCLVGFYEDGFGTAFSTYQYVPLAINASTGEREVADDVITFDNAVVFATRDSRSGHNPVNLRIMDTASALLGPDIDVQWQIMLEPWESLYGKVRLQYLEKDYFVVLYIVFNEYDNQYYLCYHRISLFDFLTGNNTIVSHQLPIDNGVDLTDVIYEPDVKVMVMLMNGENHSELYHVDPFINTSGNTYRVDYTSGNLYTIDTIGDGFSTPNADCYIAMGGGELFYQDISGGYVISRSCMPIIKRKILLKDSPAIRQLFDEVNRYSDLKSYISIPRYARMEYGLRTCMDY